MCGPVGHKLGWGFDLVDGWLWFSLLASIALIQ